MEHSGHGNGSSFYASLVGSIYFDAELTYIGFKDVCNYGLLRSSSSAMGLPPYELETDMAEQRFIDAMMSRAGRWVPKLDQENSGEASWRQSCVPYV